MLAANIQTRKQNVLWNAVVHMIAGMCKLVELVEMQLLDTLNCCIRPNEHECILHINSLNALISVRLPAWRPAYCPEHPNNLTNSNNDSCGWNKSPYEVNGHIVMNIFYIVHESGLMGVICNAQVWLVSYACATFNMFGWLGLTVFVGVDRLCMGCGWDQMDLCCCSATVTFCFFCELLLFHGKWWLVWVVKVGATKVL